MAAMGNKKTSVFDKKGNVRYPKCVIYQYHDNATAYNVLPTINAAKLLPKTTGNKKNCPASVIL